MNPDALKNQVEGAIVQTLSRTLHEEVTFDASRVTSVDWASYPILRFPEVPAIDVILIDRPDQPLLGAGEAGTVPVAAALGNAFFDATGVRLRRVAVHPRTRQGRARLQMTDARQLPKEANSQPPNCLGVGSWVFGRCRASVTWKRAPP